MQGLNESDRPSDLIYKINDKPPLNMTIFVAIQHVLAVFVGIITPPLIICQTLGFSTELTSNIISMSLFVSGVATYIQVRRFGLVGSGLLCIQGTSFSFLGALIGLGMSLKAVGRSESDICGALFGVCMVASFTEIVLSQFIDKAKKVITPAVTGTVVLLIGLTLIKVAVLNLGGGNMAKELGQFGSWQNLLVGLVVVGLIAVLSLSQIAILKVSSIIISVAVGCLVAFSLGLGEWPSFDRVALVSVPIPFKYGFGFNLGAFISISLIYVITAIETIGDLTATSMVSGEPVKGERYWNRIKGGVLGDGINSFIAGVFSTFPNTTFSQNNGIIQLTGVGSRHVGIYIAGVLSFLGLFPVIGTVIKSIPPCVIGASTLVMFGTVATSGISIIRSQKTSQRSMMIIAISLGVGLGVTFEPKIIEVLPTILADVFSSGITAGGVVAIALNQLLPGKEKFDDEKMVQPDHQPLLQS